MNILPNGDCEAVRLGFDLSDRLVFGEVAHILVFVYIPLENISFIITTHQKRAAVATIHTTIIAINIDPIYARRRILILRKTKL